jgi:hypothetical protein
MAWNGRRSPGRSSNGSGWTARQPWGRETSVVPGGSEALSATTPIFDDSVWHCFANMLRKTAKPRSGLYWPGAGAGAGSGATDVAAVNDRLLSLIDLDRP